MPGEAIFNWSCRNLSETFSELIDPTDGSASTVVNVGVEKLVGTSTHSHCVNCLTECAPPNVDGEPPSALESGWSCSAMESGASETELSETVASLCGSKPCAEPSDL